jgi:glycosyltransferase involved in cell wall biosynthesis
MEPLVSILIPAYNSEAWIEQTIKSAVAQTWPRKEIIIVDDGSKDGTAAAARQFASKEVSVVTQPNQGAAAARNKAYSLSQGDYIQWLDADDLLAPDKIAKQMEVCRAGLDKRALLSGSWANFVYRTRKARFVPSPLWADLIPLEWLVRKMEHNAHMQPATWLVSRELTDAAGPWDTRLTLDDDGEYFCRVLMASKGTRFVSEAKTFYRVTGTGSLSYAGGSSKKLDSLWLSLQLHLEYISKLDNAERTRAACLTYLQKYMFDFHPERPDIVEQLQAAARKLGGNLEMPTLSWKYAWIHRIFGWSAARETHIRYNKLKWSISKWWDKTRFEAEMKRSPIL